MQEVIPLSPAIFLSPFPLPSSPFPAFYPLSSLLCVSCSSSLSPSHSLSLLLPHLFFLPSHLPSLSCTVLLTDLKKKKKILNYLTKCIAIQLGFPGDSVVKNPPAKAGDSRDVGSIPRSRQSPEGGNSSPLQYSCLENPMDRGAWWATIHGVPKSQIQLSD